MYIYMYMYKCVNTHTTLHFQTYKSESLKWHACKGS